MVLQNNACAYTDITGSTTFAAPNSGTAMGPCHACDYVDVVMAEIDEKLIKFAPVPLLSSLSRKPVPNELIYLDWSRFRDDGFAILPDNLYAPRFTSFLQTLHPSLK